jgi:hypothetical protein
MEFSRQTASAEVKNGTNRNFSQETKRKRKVEEEKAVAMVQMRRSQVVKDINDGTQSF